MEWLLSVFRQQVNPDRVEAALESGSAKVIWVHTGAEAIALSGLMALEYHGRDFDVRFIPNKQPNALSDRDRGQRNPFPYRN
jgi:hypothetical protein